MLPRRPSPERFEGTGAVSTSASEDGNRSGVPDELEFLFHRGDPNSSGTIDISDAISIFGYLFLGSPGPAVIPAPGRTHFPVSLDPPLPKRECRMKLRSVLWSANESEGVPGLGRGGSDAPGTRVRFDRE